MSLSQPFVDIPSLSQFLMNLGSAHLDLVYNPQSQLRSGSLFLYHYTDLNGLTGIIEKHDLWLTHSRYCNDEEEMIHGLAVVKEVVQRAIASSTYDQAYLNRISLLTSEPEGVYICCFCETDNLLSQWRGYGANGTGVSIRFAPGQFSVVAGQENPHGLLRFWKVFYPAATQTRIVEDALKYYAPHLNLTETADALARKASDAIRFFIPTFKNEDFLAEVEWRLIFTPSQTTPMKPHFRVKGGLLVPYYKLRDLIGPGLPLLPIQQVLVGPSAQKRLNAESAVALLKNSGYEGVPVISSNTPFRA